MAYLITVADLGNTAHGIQGIIQKMRVDLGLECVILRPVQKQLCLILPDKESFNLIQHLVKTLTQRPYLIMFFHRYTQVCLPLFDPVRHFRQFLQRTGQALGPEEGEH